ncbi:MAG: PTS transporter subunit EIIC [Coprobacillus sp.]
MLKNSKLMDKVNDFTMKISGPLVKFSNINAVASIQDGLVACMPLIMIGSIFLILGVLGTPSIVSSTDPVLPFLSPYANYFFLVNDLTLGFLSFYASLTIAMGYAKRVHVEERTAGLLGMVTFLLINLNVIKDGTISVAAFNAKGLFVSMLVSILSVRIYKFFIDKKIVIRLPESVPPNVGNAFTSLIPYTVIFTIAWLIRSIIGFDMFGFLSEVLTPIIKAADNIISYTFVQTLCNTLWAAGLHGGNMLSAITTPIETMNIAQNAQAMTSNLPLENIWTAGFNYMHIWTSTVWPLLILMVFSKVQFLKKLSYICIPAAIFSIIEPVMFGLPLALNPFLIIPFILSTLVGSFVTYGLCLLDVFSKFFATLPWATPPFILGPLASGDFMTVVVIIINIVIGLAIFYPFFKAFERHELEKERLQEEALLNK